MSLREAVGIESEAKIYFLYESHCVCYSTEARWMKSDVPTATAERSPSPLAQLQQCADSGPENRSGSLQNKRPQFVLQLHLARG